MTIKELKEKIESLDDNMRVGGSGHFGEFLECWGAKVTEVKERGRFSNKTEMIFCISIEDPGPEPD
jgi:hypothetical protein